MQLSEADKIIGEKFPGKFRAVEYDLMTCSSGKIETRCRVYVDGGKYHSAPTFQEAIDSLIGVMEELQDIEG